MRTYRIALLLCDDPLPPVKKLFGDYRQIFEVWLKGALASNNDASARPEIDVVVDGYDVVNGGEYPAKKHLQQGANDGYDAIMISGSRHTAHESFPPFIPELISWIRDVCTDPKYLHVKIVGICFGHQIIAQAMNGRSERGDRGWEVGVYGATLTEEGKKWFISSSDGVTMPEKIYIEQMHRDHVPSPPPGFLTTLMTEKYPVQGMVKHHPASTEENPVAQIFTLQGHPEFVPELVEIIVKYRMEGGIFDSTVGSEALQRARGKDRQGGEGLQRVGWAIWRVMLNTPFGDE